MIQLNLSLALIVSFTPSACGVVNMSTDWNRPHDCRSTCGARLQVEAVAVADLDARDQLHGLGVGLGVVDDLDGHDLVPVGARDAASQDQHDEDAEALHGGGG